MADVVLVLRVEAMKGDLTREERLQIMLSPEELAAVDDFRFKQRMPSRAAAVRELFRLGLASFGIKPADAGMKSGDFGVLSAAGSQQNGADRKDDGGGDRSNGQGRPKGRGASR
jgi:hypothetical protein